jgi:MFS-type transporter involved in bile tolerance (Atg22 family)
MSISKFLVIALVVVLSVTVGYVRDRKWKLLSMLALGVVLAFYIATAQNG